MFISSRLLLRYTFCINSFRQIHISNIIHQERYYTKKHEWIQLVESNERHNEVRIGISDYAQRSLGDVVYCELPSKGTKLKCDDTFATLESVKAVSDCYMPVDGEITDVNDKIKSEPDLINKSPYENGWLIQAVIDEKNKKSLSSLLMNEKQYEQFLETSKANGDH